MSTNLNAIKPLWESLAERLIPQDAWPSAAEAGAFAYLARCLADSPGLWSDWLRPGLEALEGEAQAQYQGSFGELVESNQDALLKAVQHGQVVTNWPSPPAAFFSRLLNQMAEGYYGTPAAGGNHGGRSWQMLGFRPEPLVDPAVPIHEIDPTVTPFEAIAESYDAIVVGAGAGGAVAAAVLAEAGLHVLLVERGQWLRYDQVGTDHLRNHRLSLYGHNTGPNIEGNPRTFIDRSGAERVTLPHQGDYHNNAMTVGGGTRVYGAQAWRFHPDDFRMTTRYGVPEGSSLSDWPIGYDDLEPYYDRAEWELGVSGDSAAHPGRGRRRRDYPMPPLPPTREASILDQAAQKLGWDAGPVPLLINSVARDGRPACGRCGQCVGFACPTNSKNGSHNTMLLRAIATGRCDLVTETMVERVETHGGRHATGVRLVRAEGENIQRRQVAAAHVVVAAGAIESARLLLNSATVEEPHGVGNRFGQVGLNLQGHVYSGAFGLFDDPIQDTMGPGVSIATCRFSHGASGIIGGGMLANEFTRLPLIHWYRALPPGSRQWGLSGKALMRETYLRTGQVQGPVQEIPTAKSRVQLSPTVKDAFGIPVALLSGETHPESLRASEMLGTQAAAWMAAAGARQVWQTHAGSGLSAGQHQAGTLRMGTDPTRSATDPSGRIHGYDNLWVSDGSVHVTNGGVNPVLTILALAFRTAEQVVKHA